MKSIIISFSFLFFVLVSGLAQAQNKASLVIETAPNKEFLYWFSGTDFLSDYEQGFGRADKAKADSSGFYTKNFDISKPTTLNLGRMAKTMMTVLPVRLTSGCQDTIIVKDNGITFHGTNAEYNRCLQETETFMNYCNQLITARPSKDPLFLTKSASEFLKTLAEKKAESERNVKQFHALNSDFIDEQLAHIDLSSELAFTYKYLFNVPDSLKDNDWITAANETLKSPIKTPYFPSFRETSFLLTGLLGLNAKIETGDFKGKSVSFEGFEKLKKFMKGKNLEYAYASLINEDITYKTYDPIVPDLYETLKKEFPDNRYKSFLEAGIKENDHFNAIKADDNSNKEYQKIPCKASFRSLSDVVKSLKGKVVYVDLWATWCSSCLSEFPYLSKVEKNIKDLDVTFLYVSMDRPENAVRWEKSYRYYKLRGFQLLASPTLAKAIYKEFGNYIPHAVIFDRNGNIAERNAPGLNQAEKLHEALAKWCK